MQRRLITRDSFPAIIANARPGPLLPVEEGTVGFYNCVICHSFQDQLTLFCGTCEQPFCAPCLQAALETRDKCPYCTSEYYIPNRSEIHFLLPTRADKAYFDDVVKYRCVACDSLHDIVAAKKHDCSTNIKHKPPAYIPETPTGRLEQTEILSNSEFESWGPQQRHRLLIAHYNGRQILSRMLKRNQTLADFRKEVATAVGQPQGDISMYKFTHEELPEHRSIGDVAVSSGATYISFFGPGFTPSLVAHSAQLLFKGRGNPHMIERPTN